MSIWMGPRTKEVVLFVILLLTLSSISIGLLMGAIETHCPATSIAAKINLPYRLACELTKPRFKK